MEIVRPIEEHSYKGTTPGVWIGLQEGKNFHRVQLNVDGVVVIHENMNGRYSQYATGIKRYTVDTVPDKWAPYVQMLQGAL